jgi:hypothetical protein
MMVEVLVLFWQSSDWICGKWQSDQQHPAGASSGSGCLQGLAKFWTLKIINKNIKGWIVKP